MALTSEPSLRNYHLLPSVRGDLLAKVNRKHEAGVEFERAASLTRNARSANCCWSVPDPARTDRTLSSSLKRTKPDRNTSDPASKFFGHLAIYSRCSELWCCREL